MLQKVLVKHLSYRNMSTPSFRIICELTPIFKRKYFNFINMFFHKNRTLKYVYYAVTNSDSMAGMPFKLVAILFIPKVCVLL